MKKKVIFTKPYREGLGQACCLSVIGRNSFRKEIKG